MTADCAVCARWAPSLSLDDWNTWFGEATTRNIPTPAAQQLTRLAADVNERVASHLDPSAPPLLPRNSAAATSDHRGRPDPARLRLSRSETTLVGLVDHTLSLATPDLAMTPPAEHLAASRHTAAITTVLGEKAASELATDSGIPLLRSALLRSRQRRRHAAVALAHAADQVEGTTADRKAMALAQGETS